MTIRNYHDYELSLKEDGDKTVSLHIKKPLYLSYEGIGYGVDTLHDIVQHVFKQLPAATCKTIKFGFHKFERDGSELDFYKEVSRRITF